MASFEAKLLNLQKIQARLAALPKSAQKALEKQLDTEVEDLVPAIQRAMDAQYDERDPRHQAVRDSVHSYKNPHRVLSYFVIADAKDEHGKPIGANIEQGHRAADGTHVPAQPAFWPTYRARKKGMKRRMSSAARKAIRQEWGD